MKRSAISQHQKMSIMSNELLRRLSNTNHKREDKEETCQVIETLIKEMKHSEYLRKEIREVICSGIIGWRRKIERREKEGGSFYRSAASTLPSRCQKNSQRKLAGTRGGEEVRKMI